MKVTGKLFRGTVVFEEVEYTAVKGGSYQDQLEECLLGLCTLLQVSLPMWISKNTREFIRYKRTTFLPDQFMDPVRFDRMEMRVVV